MKRFFEKELHVLNKHITEMAHKALEQVKLAVQALEKRDFELAGWIRTQDDELDRIEMEIDAEAIRYISLRAPVARELRMVVTAMNIAHEIERIGDEASNIAKRAQKLAHLTPSKPVPADMRELAQKVVTMLEETFASFLEGDAEKAMSLRRRDKEIDDLHKRLSKAITQETVEQTETAPAAIELLFAARALERIGDHATNLAEEIVYIHRGEDVRHAP